MAFALFSPILSPECPPSRPPISIVTGIPSFSFFLPGRVQISWAPPAQPAVMMPSSSESRLIILRLLSEDRSSPSAPRRPTSSSTVKMHSRGGHLSDSSARRASIMATAIPLSAPRVVRSAVSHSPSVSRVMGWVSRSMSFEASLARTMSIWPCRATGSRSSKPADPCLRMIRLPMSSL